MGGGFKKAAFGAADKFQVLLRGIGSAGAQALAQYEGVGNKTNGQSSSLWTDRERTVSKGGSRIQKRRMQDEMSWSPNDEKSKNPAEAARRLATIAELPRNLLHPRQKVCTL